MFLSFLTVITFFLWVSPYSFAHQIDSITPIQWPEKITPKMLLGKRLFFDKRLSRDDETSCASCHQFDRGGSSFEKRSILYSGQLTKHNSTSIFNLTQNYNLGWIGQLASAEFQLNNLIAGKKVMGLSWEEIEQRIKQDAEYVKLFAKVFAAKELRGEINRESISQAIVAYEHALTTPSPFDLYLQGDKSAITEQAIQGFELFQDYGCVSCHQGKNIGGNLFQKLGVFKEYQPGASTEDSTYLGRYNYSGKNKDKQVFRVPSLRNVALTSPYFHDGSIDDLETVIKLMAKHQLGRSLTSLDIARIIAFLQSLNGMPHPELIP